MIIKYYVKFRIASNWPKLASLAYLEYLPVKGLGKISARISGFALFACRLSHVKSGFQDHDQGPHPKAAKVNGKTLIVFSGLWIRPQELSHTLNGTLFEAKQAQGFIHVGDLTVE